MVCRCLPSGFSSFFRLYLCRKLLHYLWVLCYGGSMALWLEWTVLLLKWLQWIGSGWANIGKTTRLAFACRIVSSGFQCFIILYLEHRGRGCSTDHLWMWIHSAVCFPTNDLRPAILDLVKDTFMAVHTAYIRSRGGSRRILLSKPDVRPTVWWPNPTAMKIFCPNPAWAWHR